MKTKSILLALFILAPILSSAQVSWIVKGGPSANVSNQGLFGSDAKTGGRIGVGMEYSLGRIVSIQPALMLNFKGAKEKSTSRIDYTSEDITHTTYTCNTTDYRQTYIEVPVDVLFRVRVHEQKNALVFSVGPYFAYGIGGNTTLAKNVNGVRREYKEDTFDKNGINMRRFDFGLSNGVYFELKKHLTFGAYYEYGLIKTKDNQRDDTFYDWYFGKKNLSLGLEVGYRF